MRLATVVVIATCLALLATCIATGCKGPDAAGSLSAGLGGICISAIADPALGSAAASAYELKLAPGDGSDGTLAVAVHARQAIDVRAAFFRVTFDPARFTLLRTETGAGLRDLCAQGQLLELYKLAAPGVVECGQVLPNWDKRQGYSGAAELATLYFTRHPSPATMKSACQPPDNDQSKATLTFNGVDTLQWRFYSQGDYNQNGIVDVGDLTPLGVHYNQTVTYPGQVDTALAAIDGNPDGLISLSDLAPIGINYGKNIGHGWNIYSCNNVAFYPIHWDEGNGLAVPEGNVAVDAYDASTNPATDRVLYMFAIPAPVPGDIYWVRPVDDTGTEGIASNYEPAGNNSPFAIFTTHAGNGEGLAGIAAHCVYFDATSSFDPDGNPIVSYAWDFESDGTVDETTATPLHIFYTARTYNVKLTVSDGTATGEDTRTIVVTHPGNFHVVTVDALDDAGRLCSLASIGGFPAIAYRQQSGSNVFICYAQSNSYLGESGTWSTPVNVVTDNVQWISLAEVNGQPAIAYYRINGVAPSLCYCLFDGTSWSSVVLDESFDAGNYCNLLVYDGKPNIVYYRRNAFGDGELCLLRAGNAGGTVWPLPPAVIRGTAGADVGAYVSALARPGAINAAYYDALNQQLRFTYPDSPLLGTWSGLAVDPRAGWDTGSIISLAIADGNPCIAYYAYTAGPPVETSVLFARANDAMGTNWSGPIDTIFSVAADEISLAIVDGQPAVALWLSGSLGYFRSSEFTRFSTPETAMIEPNPSENAGQYCKMVIIDGRPCIAYYEAVNQELRFACRY